MRIYTMDQKVCLSLLLSLSTLNPLSTFMRGARVAVMKYREHGDHPCVTEQWALLDPIFLVHVQSNDTMGTSQILVGSSQILPQTGCLPESQCIEKIHVSG